MQYNKYVVECYPQGWDEPFRREYFDSKDAAKSHAMYKNKPHLALCSGVFCLSEERLWDYDDCGGIKMNKDKYRKVTFSNSPRKVEVELKLIEK